MGKRTKQIVESETESENESGSDYESDIDPEIFERIKNREQNPVEICKPWNKLPKNAVIKIEICSELISGKFGNFYKIKYNDEIYYGHKNLEFRIKDQKIDINKTIFLKISKKKMESHGNIYHNWVIVQ